MNRIILLALLCGLYGKSVAQIDSSAIFERRISGGSTKVWHPAPPPIIDVPRDKPQLTFTFNLKPKKTAKFVLPRGRDLPVVRTFELWSIKKLPDSTYNLIFPRGEKYVITFQKARDKTWILMLTDASELHIGKVGGMYFEKEFRINP